MKSEDRIWVRRWGLLAVSAALLFSNFAFFLWYRSTALERKDALEARRAALSREVETREEEATMLERQRNRLSQVTAALDEFYNHRVGARRESLTSVVAELHRVFERVGISPGQISYSTAPLEDLSLSQMVMTFGFKSDYSKLKQLLAALENNSRWIVLRDLGLSRDTDVPGSIQTRMALVTYFSGEEKPSRGARLPAKRR